MKKILFPTDFSQTAINAMEYAMRLFEHDFCKFYILHAYQQDIYESGVSITKEILNQVTKSASENSQKELEKTLKIIKNTASNPKHTYKIISANNILIDEVDTIVDERDIDLIIMGTRGKTNNKKTNIRKPYITSFKVCKMPRIGHPKKL